MSYIEFSDVGVELNGASILKHVSASFDRGMIHGIIGRNGSGKSVMFKTMCGFIRASSGSVTVNGKRVGVDVDHPDSLGFIINDSGFLPRYSGYKNLRFIARVRNVIGADEISSAMKLVGLDPKSRKPVAHYSTGMKQRLPIAQAIMENPSLLVLDEPMNGLDDSGVREMRMLFERLKREDKTIMMASHNREDIEELCDTVYKMDAGILTRVR